MKKILISSNTPFCSSGYGIQSLYLIEVFKKLGYDVYFLAWNVCIREELRYNYFSIEELFSNDINFLADKDYINDVKHQLVDVKMYCNIYESFPHIIYPNDVNKIIEKENIDLFFYLLDIWIIDPIQKFSCKSVCWLPLHFSPLEEITLKVLPVFDEILCLSNYCRDLLKKYYIDKDYLVVPHIVDKCFFKDIQTSRSEFRKLLGISEDKYLISIIARNSEATNRKSFEANIEAFNRFSEKVPNAVLYLHTNVSKVCNIINILAYNNISPKKVYIVDQEKIESGLDNKYLMGIYLATDILLNASSSEGFGLPIVEAQMFGCPAIGSDCTAMKYTIFNGLKASILQKKYVYTNCSYWYLPDVISITDCLFNIYNRSEKEKEKMKNFGIRMIDAKFSFKKVQEIFKNLVNSDFKKIK